MAQFVVYGHAAALRPRIAALSNALHSASVSELHLPEAKRFHRFIPLEPDCFITPSDRSADYTIIEISMFEGRSVAAKKNLIRALYRSVDELGIGTQDLEITISETPRSNWGIRGMPGDEPELDYPVGI
jgi:phenylpyruvate tautomerase PptA (4-oxalocrotonate tautomerase family)